MQTLHAQSTTLKTLRLHEVGIGESKESYIPWKLTDAETVTTSRKLLQDVENAAKIRRACAKPCHSNPGVTDP